MIRRFLYFLLGFTVAILLVLFLPAWMALALLLEGWLEEDGENVPNFVQIPPSPTAERGGRGLQGAFSARTVRGRKRA